MTVSNEAYAVFFLLIFFIKACAAGTHSNLLDFLGNFIDWSQHMLSLTFTTLLAHSAAEKLIFFLFTIKRPCHLMQILWVLIRIVSSF